MTKEWTFTITPRIELPTTVNIPISGVNISGDIPLVSGVLEASIEGSVKWECKTPPILQIQDSTCYTRVHDIERHDPAVKTEFNSDPYQVAAFLQPYTATIPGFGHTMKQPGFLIGLDMDLMPENDGKCINVAIKCVLDFDPAVLKVSATVPPVGVVTAEGVLGQPGRSIFVANYRLCCCDYVTTIPIYDEQRDGPGELYEGILNHEAGATGTGIPECASDHSVTNIPPPVSQTGSVGGLTWRIKTTEKTCVSVVTVAQNAPFDTPNRRVEGKSEVKVRPEP